MKRLTILAAALVMLVGASGCASTNSCNSCNSCNNSGGGLLGKLGGGNCNPSTGCRANGLAWQQGGLDYSEGLATGNPRHAQPGRQSPMVAGPPTAGVAYPYYTVRGPRDFLMDNPPSIGR